MSEWQARDLLGKPRKELAALLRAGHPIDPTQLDDSDYRGISLGVPRWVEALTWKKFKKVFRRDPLTGKLTGYNVRLEQNDLEGACIAKRKNGEDVTFGPYEVVEPVGVPAGCDRGLLIDYGLGEGAGRFEPTRAMRDPIVALEAGSCELLLGWSYLQLGRFQLGTPSYFSLTRC